jgi:hypothetical protein
MNESNQYPSMGKQASSLAKFTFQIIKKALHSEALFVSDKVYNERLDVCKSCDYFDPEQTRCRQCGCYLEQKARFALDSCPINKWDESDIDWTQKNFDDVLDRIHNPENYAEENMPVFPMEPVEGQFFEWNEHKWKWTNNQWEYVVQMEDPIPNVPYDDPKDPETCCDD